MGQLDERNLVRSGFEGRYEGSSNVLIYPFVTAAVNLAVEVLQELLILFVLLNGFLFGFLLLLIGLGHETSPL